MRFELRLQNGSKLFPIGMGWHQIIGEAGTATVRECPGFCRDADLADCFAPHAKAGWSFWRLGDAARKELLDRAWLCAPLTMSDAAQSAGFISIEHRSNQQREVRVDVLSVAPAGKEGASIFDEWSRIVAEAKHDLNREVLLRLNFFAEAGFRDFDLDGFRAGKRLGTTDIELEVRPSAIQFARDD